MTGEVVFLEGSTRLAPRLMRRARELGYGVRFLSRAERLEAVDPAIVREADDVDLVDTYDLTRVVHRLDCGRVAAVLALDDYHLVPAALLASALGLPVENLSGLLNARFKDRTRSCLRGTPGAVGFEVIAGDRPPAESPLGYPCIVKPLDAAGSTGVRVCRDGASFREAVADIREHHVNYKGYRLADRLLVEEYVAGPEFSAELGWDNREERWQPIGITRKFITEPPYCVELRHVFPHLLEEPLRGRVWAAVIDWLARVGFDHGMAHVEFKLDDGLPRLMEINPRVSGDLIDRLVFHASGIDMPAWYLDLHLGLPVSQAVDAQPTRLATVQFLVASAPGTVVRLAADESLRDSVEEFHLASTPRPIRGLRSSDDRLGYAIASGDDLAAIQAAVARFVAAVEIDQEPLPPASAAEVRPAGVSFSAR